MLTITGEDGKKMFEVKDEDVSPTRATDEEKTPKEDINIVLGLDPGDRLVPEYATITHADGSAETRVVGLVVVRAKEEGEE